MKTKILACGLISLPFIYGCKNRLFNLSGEPPTQTSSTTPATPDTRSGQIAISQQSSDDSKGQTQSNPAKQNPTGYSALKDTSTKNIQLGQTLQFTVNGKSVEVTFVSIIEDSRCPKNVVCIWEGLAKLQFKVSIPSVNLVKTVEPILRAGHPHLGQVMIGDVGLDLVGLSPDTATTRPSAAQRSSPEATLSVGKAP